MILPTLAILGKPNVGKSSLFNRLCGKRLAIVDNRPGVTRDRKVFAASIAGLNFQLMDTAGWEQNDNMMSNLMAENSLVAAQEADAILFMVEAQHGLSKDDIDFARIVRNLSKPVILLVNKCESNHRLDLNSIYQLGLGDPVFIAAHTGMGFDELRFKISKLQTNFSKLKPLPEAAAEVIKVCIVGRPNAGKSTLFNRLLQMERAITSPLAGTTRDSINHFLEYGSKTIELIDTAGLRKRGNIDNKLEGMSAAESINAIRRSNLVLLMVDATQSLEKQDLTIAHVAINEGKAVLLVANKIDLIDDLKDFKDQLHYLAEKGLNELKGLPIISTCALKDLHTDAILQHIVEMDQRWRFQINTGHLNRWLKNATSAHIPPLGMSGRRIRLKYATQSGIKPPTFLIFANTPLELPASYTQYLINSMRKEFNLGGVPIRIIYRKNDNPFVH